MKRHRLIYTMTNLHLLKSFKSQWMKRILKLTVKVRLRSIEKNFLNFYLQIGFKHSKARKKSKV